MCVGQVCDDALMCLRECLQLRQSVRTLARYLSSLETTVNSTSRAGRAMPYATTYVVSSESSD